MNAPPCTAIAIPLVSDDVQHAAAAAFWAAVSATTSAADVPGGAASWATAPGDADAPARPMPESHAPPPAETSDTRDRLEDGATTYSSNRTARVPAPRSSSAESIPGGAVSGSNSREAVCATFGLPDTSKNAPGPTTTEPPEATTAAATAFSCGERVTTTVSEVGVVLPGTDTVDDPSATSDMPGGAPAASSTRRGRASATLTYSSNLRVSVPSFMSRRGWTPARRRGLTSSSTTRISNPRCCPTPVECPPSWRTAPLPDRSANAPVPSDVNHDELRITASAFCFCVSSSVTEYCGVKSGGRRTCAPPSSTSNSCIVALSSSNLAGTVAEAFTCSSNHTVSEPVDRSRRGSIDSSMPGGSASRTRFKVSA